MNQPWIYMYSPSQSPFPPPSPPDHSFLTSWFSLQDPTRSGLRPSLPLSSCNPISFGLSSSILQVIFLSFIFFHIPSCHTVFAHITLNDLPSFLSLIPTFLLKYLFRKEVFLDFPDESTNSNKGSQNTEYFWEHFINTFIQRIFTENLQCVKFYFRY